MPTRVFETDLNAIRKRAREKMSEGAVTDAYMADRDRVVVRQELHAVFACPRLQSDQCGIGYGDDLGTQPRHFVFEVFGSFSECVRQRNAPRDVVDFGRGLERIERRADREIRATGENAHARALVRPTDGVE